MSVRYVQTVSSLYAEDRDAVESAAEAPSHLKDILEVLSESQELLRKGMTYYTSLQFQPLRHLLIATKLGDEHFRLEKYASRVVRRPLML